MGLIAGYTGGRTDNIIMRALEVEPARRYQSAALFAEDLNRYFEHQPVLAKPPDIGYRARKSSNCVTGLSVEPIHNLRTAL